MGGATTDLLIRGGHIAAIDDMLRQHGRDGVPLYLYRAPGAARPVVLPRILTESAVMEALRSR